MILAVSNIAWPLDAEDSCFEVLKRNQFDFLEIAPTKYWTDLESVSMEEVQLKQASISSRGLTPVSAQSLLFGKPELKIFGSDEEVEITFNYLKKVIDVCSAFGCKALVFGSPKNRLKGSRTFSEAVREVTPLFRRLGKYSFDKGTLFCIEPNATAYGCDFVTNVDDAICVVESVATEGFGLHLDVGNMVMTEENISESISKAGSLIKHFHISAPYLAPVLELEKHLSKEDWVRIAHLPTCLSVEMLIKAERYDNMVGILDLNLSFVARSLGSI